MMIMHLTQYVHLIAGDYNGTNSNPFAAVDFMDEIAIWNKEFNMC